MAVPPAPPAPPLSPEESLSRLRVAPGFRVELVASEPLVQAPVSIAFDADGRLWVVEMPGYMQTVDGAGETAPTGRVVVLEDRDGDGRMDRRTVFLDGLVLPKSVGFIDGGVVIGAPPQLLFCRDDDHDDRCDRPQLLSSRYGDRQNPEHDANGLVPAIDNWLYSANIAARHRVKDGRLVEEPTNSRGQWGIAQDDLGRLVYDDNSDYLRGDLLPAFVPEAHVRGTAGVNVALDEDQTTWPARPTPGVNRGYQSQTLRPDGTLARFTAACGPIVYRGDQFPPAFRGNAFVAEPAANFVRRSVVEETGERLRGHNAYERSEFLASLDERFRPVSLANGPEGALYVVDFYRGLIQHRIYLTPFLKAQVQARKLDRPLDYGRIYRVVSTERPVPPRLALGRAKPEELVRALSHPNGFWRDTAQRCLVERQERRAVPALRSLLRTAPSEAVRLHAFFTLDGLGALAKGDLRQAERDQAPWLREAARAIGRRAALAKLDAFARELKREPRPEPARLWPAQGQELELLQRLCGEPPLVRPPARPERADELLSALARGVAATGDRQRIGRLVELAALEPKQETWRAEALLAGLAQGLPAAGVPPGPRPAGWGRLASSNAPALRSATAALAPRLGLAAPRPAAPPLTPEEQQRFARGRAQYPSICGACHQPSGLGEAGKAPPLVDSPWVLGPEERLVRIALLGLRGPVEVGGGRRFDADMPGLAALGDEELAALLTYVRRESDWGHAASAVSPATVARVRAQLRGREEPWSSAELAGN